MWLSIRIYPKRLLYLNCIHFSAIDHYFPANVYVHESGILTMPSKVEWLYATSTIKGQMGGVTELTLNDADLTLGESSMSRVSLAEVNCSVSYTQSL